MRLGRYLRIGMLALPLMGTSPVCGHGQGVPAGARTLRELRDRARVLLIFSPAADDARMLEQLKRVRDNAAGAAERDLVVVAVPERGSAGTEVQLTPWDAAAARRRFRLGAGEFRVILVGKDGGEKLRSGEPIAFARLREAIDAMPMRQEEMKAKSH